MNRGSLAGVCHVDDLQIGFNEAPIHESGKCTGELRNALAGAGLQ